MKTLGLDIGTTTVCAVLTDVETREVIRVKTVENDSAVKSDKEWECMQKPERILEICRSLVEEIQKEDEIDAIGVTGQMHGILYLDEQGRAVSNLYTWQDKSGEEMYLNRKSYAQYMQEKTGYAAASGYGMTTCFFHTKNRMIPETAAVFCTIPDYIAMQLAGIEKPIIHQSMAASLGLYNLETKCFDKTAVKTLGINEELLPIVVSENRSIGKMDGKLPVAAAFGDNQASYLGTVEKQGEMLVNIGTGGQISVMTKEYLPAVDLEYRPYIGSEYLAVGASLCGGYAYAMMKKFIEKTAELLGVETETEVYEKMNAAAAKVYQAGNSVKVDTRFKGTRKEPDIRGTVSGLTPENLLPQNLICGVLEGIVQELKTYYEQFPDTVKHGGICYASGNGVRRNPLMQQMIEDAFGKEVVFGKYLEEAAYGVSLFAAQTIK